MKDNKIQTLTFFCQAGLEGDISCNCMFSPPFAPAARPESNSWRSALVGCGDRPAPRGDVPWDWKETKRNVWVHFMTLHWWHISTKASQDHLQIDCLFNSLQGKHQSSKWKRFPCYWPFVRGNHWSLDPPVTSGSPHKGSVTWKSFPRYGIITKRCCVKKMEVKAGEKHKGHQRSSSWL